MGSFVAYSLSSYIPALLRELLSPLPTTLIALFGAIFQPLVGFLLDLAWGENPDKIVPVYTPQDYLFALTLIVAFLFTLFLREKGIRAQNNLV